MFRSATLRLTLWYLAIIMVISLAFSWVLYRVATTELDTRLRHQSLRLQVAYGRLYIAPNPPDTSDLQLGAENILRQLVLFNILVMMAGGGASYLLARRTLQPIERTHDLQKRFTGDAAHELRTPLAAMKTEIEVLLRGRDASNEELRELLQSNLEEIAKLETLSGTLLQLARIEAQNADVMNACALKPIVKEAIERISKAATQRTITIEPHLAKATVRGDHASLVQLVVILLDNAIKYSPEGSKVHIRLSTNAKQALIDIEDHGQGIPEADLPHIFERFYRADSSRTKTRTTGFGLGLSLAKLIAHHHHGVIIVKSAPGKGTTATISLPLI